MGNFEINDSTFEDRVVCLDVKTGKELWSHKYKCPEYEDPGPCATPILNEGKLYTLSREGDLICLNALNGELIWKTNLVEEQYMSKQSYFATSPVIYKNMIVLNLNKEGIALNKKTGELVWNSEKGGSDLSTPVLIEHNKKTYVTIQDNDRTLVLNPSSGEKVWKISSGYVSDPIMVDDDIIIFGRGIERYKLKANSKVEKIWTNSESRNSFQSYVSVGKYIYGFDDFSNNYLQCVDANTGEVKWREKMSAGNLIASKDILIVIDKKGVLRFIKAQPESFSEIKSAQIIHNERDNSKGRRYRRECACWTNPVLSGGKLYLRNTYGELACLDLIK